MFRLYASLTIMSVAFVLFFLPTTTLAGENAAVAEAGVFDEAHFLVDHPGPLVTTTQNFTKPISEGESKELKGVGIAGSGVVRIESTKLNSDPNGLIQMSVPGVTEVRLTTDPGAAVQNYPVYIGGKYVPPGTGPGPLPDWVGAADVNVVAIPSGIKGPLNVPGLSRYIYEIDLEPTDKPMKIVWSVDNAAVARFDGATDNRSVAVLYKNAPAEITVRVDYELNNKPKVGSDKVAVVQITNTFFSFLHRKVPTFQASAIFLVDNLNKKSVCTFNPGSKIKAFTSLRKPQAAEPAFLQRVVSITAGGIITLTPPKTRPKSVSFIQVGYIQTVKGTGFLSYKAKGYKRRFTIACKLGLDWTRGTPSPKDDWPWYDKSSRSDPNVFQTERRLSINDSPSTTFPSKWNPLSNDPEKESPLSKGFNDYEFTLYLGARTLETATGADKLYFDEGSIFWRVAFAYPAKKTSATFFGEKLNLPRKPTEIPVHIVPGSVLINEPYRTWEPVKPKPKK